MIVSISRVVSRLPKPALFRAKMSAKRNIHTPMRIAYCFEPIRNWAGKRNDDLRTLIDLHERSLRQYGWEAVWLSERDAQKHPRYDFFCRTDTILAKSKNEWPYTRACYMRWLAYAAEGIPFSDFDVLNYGFTPEDAQALMAERKMPLLLSFAGAVGLLQGACYETVIDLFIDFAAKPDSRGLLASEDINDMTTLRKLRPDWFPQVPAEDTRYAKDYTAEGWREAKLVHYPYHFAPVPRGRSAVKARPPGGIARAEVIKAELDGLGCRSLLDLTCDSGSVASDLFLAGFKGAILSVASAGENRKSPAQSIDNTTSWMMLPLPDKRDSPSIAQPVPHEIIDMVTGHALAEPVRAGFDALMITSRLLIPEQLGRLLGSLPSLTSVVLMRGMEDVTEATDTPDLADVWQRHGFRLNLSKREPGIRFYERPAAETAALDRNQEYSFASVVTSLGPMPKRVSAANKDFGKLWLAYCAASWRRTAPRVRSISEIAPPLPGIEWVEVSGKPAIAEMFASMAPEDDKPVLMVNADILMTQSFQHARKSLHKNIFYCGSRLDVEAHPGGGDKFSDVGYFKGGFDYFILPAAFIRSLNANKSVPDFLRIGEPWWDYAVPVLALANGFPVKRLVLKQPAAFHLKHPVVSSKYVLEHGYKFIEWLKELDQTGAGTFLGLLPPFCARRSMPRSTPSFRFWHAPCCARCPDANAVPVENDSCFQLFRQSDRGDPCRPEAKTDETCPDHRHHGAGRCLSG